MRHRAHSLVFGFCVLGVLAQASNAQEAGSKDSTAAAVTAAAAEGRTATGTSKSAVPVPTGVRPLYIDILKARGLKKPATAAGIRLKDSVVTPRTGGGTPSAASGDSQAYGEDFDNSGIGPTLPLWTFRVRSSRDGNKYSGAMVGQNPFRNPGPTTVPTKIIPLIIRVHNQGVSLDPNTGIISTAPGDITFDPTKADTQNTCLSAPNNVATKLVKQSPILTPSKFVFGGTKVGTTQYLDAFQRANFWGVLGSDRDHYHVLLQPEFLEPIVLDVPSVYGVALGPNFFGPPAFCGAFGIVDINWFDTYLTGTVIPSLSPEVDPTNFPVFLVYNVVWGAPVTNLAACCALGYHGTTGFPVPTQTYSPADFDTSGAFSADGSGLDTAVLSHEIGEWINDPMISNPTPPWGNTGQVQGGCQANLEVGDPLSGSDLPLVTMPNGFPYHLQELAFFSWFFGAPSTGVNGWYSDNDTFVTDAGAPCH